VTWDSLISSIEDSAQRECYEVVAGAIIYRFVRSDRNANIGGFTYEKTSVERSEVSTPTLNGRKQLTFTLALDHAFVQRWFQQAIPPAAYVNIISVQQSDSSRQRIFSGEIVACEVHSTRDGVATFTAISRMELALGRRLPTVSVGRQCPHVLYDFGCKLNRNAFRVVTTAQIVNGPFVTVQTMSGHPDGWAKFGELLHVPSGDRMPIRDQVGALVTLQLPIVGMQTGDQVQVFAGCAHDAQTCSTKFDNILNFGGFPELPRANPFIPNGLGIYTSEG